MNDLFGPVLTPKKGWQNNFPSLEAINKIIRLYTNQGRGFKDGLLGTRECRNDRIWTQHWVVIELDPAEDSLTIGKSI
jgi:hypothetical protein